MSERVLAVLGGEPLPQAHLRRWAETANALYGADSGADRLLEVGFLPVLVGDLDSFQSEPRRPEMRVVHLPDQDSSDCDKVLELIHRDGHSQATLAGVEGGWPDHFLGILSSCVASTLRLRLVFARGLGFVVRPEHSVRLDRPAGSRVSLMPLEPCRGVDLAGVAWPLYGERLAVGGLVSLSNRALGGEISVFVGSGTALLFAEFAPEELPRW